MAIAEAVVVVKAVAVTAELIDKLDKMFKSDEPGKSRELDDQLARVLTDLARLKHTVITATEQILEAIEGVSHQIDEDVANENITRANTALYNHLMRFNDKKAAMQDSFFAADRLFKETNLIFTVPFSYVVDIRHLIVKDFDPCYPAVQSFKDEFGRYISKLTSWISEVNAMVARSHTVSLFQEKEVDQGVDGKPVVIRYWVAEHRHNGRRVARFSTQDGQVGRTADEVRAKAESSRSRAMTADRQQFGVVHMEQTLAALRKPFGGGRGQRQALVHQVLNRPMVPSDLDPDGLLVDGRIVPLDGDLRSTLAQLLASSEFRERVQASWRAFVERGDARLMKIAHRRLFDRDPRDDEVEVLRSLASTYGYKAVVAALLHSDAYEERFGSGMPGGRDDVPVLEALEALELADGNGSYAAEAPSARGRGEKVAPR